MHDDFAQLPCGGCGICVVSQVPCACSWRAQRVAAVLSCTAVQACTGIHQGAAGINGCC